MSERSRSMMGDRWVLDWDDGAWILTEYREDQIAGKVIFPEDIGRVIAWRLGFDNGKMTPMEETHDRP